MLKEMMEEAIEMNKVVTYEPTKSRRYKTILVNIEEVNNGFGYIKVVTFKGLKLNRNDVDVIDSTITFQCEYSKTFVGFDDIPFGSVISLCTKPVLTVTNDEQEELRLYRPTKIEIEEEGFDGSFKPYIKFPTVDLKSHIPIIIQLSRMGIEYNQLKDFQQERVRKLEYLRRKEENKVPLVKYIGKLTSGMKFEDNCKKFM